MTRSLTAEEIAAQPPSPLGSPVDRPLTLHEVVWASAYGAAFAEQYQMAWEALDGTDNPTRNEDAGRCVSVARCKAAADAAVERMGER